MNLMNIIKPAMNSLALVAALSFSMQYITPVINNQLNNDAQSTSELTTPTVQSTTTPTVTAKPTVAATKKASPTAVPKPKVATCIITVNGSRYNVQALRKTHSGGDIFKCGTDMTTVFRNMHGTNYSLIAKYKI